MFNYFICLQDDIGEQGFAFFAISQKPIISLTRLKEVLGRFIMSTRGQNNGGFRWVIFFNEYLCGCYCQNWCGGIFPPTVTISNLDINVRNEIYITAE